MSIIIAAVLGTIEDQSLANDEAKINYTWTWNQWQNKY